VQGAAEHAIAEVPAAQREVSIGEVRFTLPFGGTITIAATSVSSSAARSARGPTTGASG